MGKHRIFIAIDIPEELKNAVEAEIKKFFKNELARVVKRVNWHITVVFCGYLDNEKLEQLKETARKIADETKSFELTPDKIIFKNKRMIWLTFKRSAEFDNLSKKFIAFADNGILKPLPHATLARFEEKHYSNLKNLLPEDGIDLMQETKPFGVKQIDIMESHLSPRGLKYELLCRNYLK